MRVNVWSNTILVTSMVVLSSSDAAAQSGRQELLSDPGSLSEPLDRTSLALEGGQQLDDQERSRSLFRDVIGDFGKFVTTSATGVILGVGLAGSLSVSPLDERIRYSRAYSGAPGYERPRNNAGFEAGNRLGSSVVQVGGAFATYTIGRWVGTPAVAELGRDLVRAQLLTAGVTRLLKHTVRRTRPDGVGSSRTSFPSGHTSGTFASATVLSQHYGWKVGLPAFGLASYAAAARVANNSHFLSDVVFGAVIGMAASRTVTFESGTVRLEVAPMAVPRGLGVRVSVN